MQRTVDWNRRKCQNGAVTLEQYRKNQLARLQAEIPPRQRCLRCRRPAQGCYCSSVKAFAPEMEFALLIHLDETRRAVATGRMAHLCLRNSHLLEGIDYTRDERVNRLIEDPANYPVLLYPGCEATDISNLTPESRRELVPAGKKLVVFLLDGTWSTARKMYRLSTNLHSLPMICFTPRAPSRFAVRRQPAARCYSTVESVHEVIDLLTKPGSSRPHDNLLDVFGQMVQQQMHFRNEIGERRFFRKVKNRVSNGPRRGLRKIRRTVREA